MRMARAGVQQQQSRTQGHGPKITAGFVLEVSSMVMAKGAIEDACECPDSMIQAEELEEGRTAFAVRALRIVCFKRDDAEAPKEK